LDLGDATGRGKRKRDGVREGQWREVGRRKEGREGKEGRGSFPHCF